MPSFIILWYVWQILGRGPFCPLIRDQPQKDPSWIGLNLKQPWQVKIKQSQVDSNMRFLYKMTNHIGMETAVLTWFNLTKQFSNSWYNISFEEYPIASRRFNLVLCFKKQLNISKYIQVKNELTKSKYFDTVVIDRSLWKY